MLEVKVGSVRAGLFRPYVYIGFSRDEHIAYVGQTFDRRGLLGRWTDHLSSPEHSSFIARLTEHDEDAFARICDLTILAWDLGDHPSFGTLETTHREAVEYLVQRELWSFCGNLDPWLKPISSVRTSREAGRDFIRAKATEIIEEFRNYYERIGQLAP